MKHVNEFKNEDSLNEGRMDRKVRKAIDDFEFTGIDIEKYQELANQSKNALEYMNALLDYFEEEDFYVDAETEKEVSDFATSVFKNSKITSVDFEDYDDTDVSGMAMEMLIDGIIEEAQERLESEIGDKREMNLLKKEIKRLWVDKIKQWKYV